MARTPSCVWRITPELLLALDARFGEPTDAYVNGSQVWLRDDAPGGATVEWRLHPVAGYTAPPETGVHEVFAEVVYALRGSEVPPAPPDTLWDGLEAFPAYGDELEPAPLAAALTEVLGLAPDAFGLVDHVSLGDAWERSGGAMSLVDALMAELQDPGTR